MSASAYILQMVRAHYGRDERAFSAAASTLARHANSATLRADIMAIVQRGLRSPQGGQPAAGPRRMEKIKSAVSSSLAAGVRCFADPVGRSGEAMTAVVLGVRMATVRGRESGVFAVLMPTRNKVIDQDPCHCGSGEPTEEFERPGQRWTRCHCCNIWGSEEK